MRKQCITCRMWEIPWNKGSGGKFQIKYQLSCVQLFATQITAARQASLSITSSRSLLKLTSIELVMPSNHLVLFCPLLLLPSILLSIRVFSNKLPLHIRWSKYWSFSFGHWALLVRHRSGLLWYWMVCLGNEQRSFCRFWDCIQVLHFRLFCWLWTYNTF